jgi:ATP-dependent Lon protease
MKIMTQKLNEKYKDVLNEQQRALVKAYAFSVASEDQSTITSKLIEIKGKLLKRIEERIDSNVDNSFLNEKMKEVKEALIQESIEDVNDNTVTRFMLYSRLQNELDTED